MKKLLELFKDELKDSKKYLQEWKEQGQYPSDESTPEYEQGYSDALSWVVDKLEQLNKEE